jgi:hypothetical protein
VLVGDGSSPSTYRDLIHTIESTSDAEKNFYSSTPDGGCCQPGTGTYSFRASGHSWSVSFRYLVDWLEMLPTLVVGPTRALLAGAAKGERGQADRRCADRAQRRVAQRRVEVLEGQHRGSAAPKQTGVARGDPPALTSTSIAISAQTLWFRRILAAGTVDDSIILVPWYVIGTWSTARTSATSPTRALPLQAD